MKNYWLRFGCFLSGYNYHLVVNSSEKTARTVKKYTSAILIVGMIWGFIAFMFSYRYVQPNYLTSSLVSLAMIIIVVQIERLIILSDKSVLAGFFRIIIATVMAVIGSVIIDQIIFKEDVEKEKISNIQNEVEDLLSLKTAQLDQEITSLDTLIQRKEAERADLINEVTQKPFIKGSTSERKAHKMQITSADGLVRDTIISRTDLTLIDMPNPKAELIAPLDNQIAKLRDQKEIKQSSRINIRQELENELKSKTGFLDEISILIAILLSSKVALFIWLCLFLFFGSIELFVFIIKYSDGGNDYDETLNHQVAVRTKILQKLSDNGNGDSKDIVNIN